MCVYVCVYIYIACPENIQPCTAEVCLLHFIEEDTRYKRHCTWDNDTSVPFKVGILGPHIVLSIVISCPVVFS